MKKFMPCSLRWRDEATWMQDAAAQMRKATNLLPCWIQPLAAFRVTRPSGIFCKKMTTC